MPFECDNPGHMCAAAIKATQVQIGQQESKAYQVERTLATRP